MLLNFLSNPIVILFIASLLIMVLMFLFVGKKKTKPKKIEKAIEKKVEEPKADEGDKSQAKTEEEIKKDIQEEIEKKTEEFNKVDEVVSETKDKKVTKLYVRKQQNKESISQETNEGDSKYDDLLDRAEFVKTSKHVAKLNGFRQNAEEEQLTEIEVQKEEIDACEECKEIKTRIDHSKRLSDSVKNDNFDELFVGHLSEHYLNIDSDRHLSSDLMNDIFERTNQLMNNAESRMMDAESQEAYSDLKTDKERLKFLMERNRPISTFSNQASKNPDEQFEMMTDDRLSLKQMVLAEMLLKRRKKIKK